MNIEEIKDEINVIDNFLPQNEFAELQNTMMNGYFPWFRHEGIDAHDDGQRQFVHVFFNHHTQNSNFFPLLTPLLNKIDPVALCRIKANLLPPTAEIMQFQQHVDYEETCITAILYITSNNGYTVFENGQKVESVENRLLTFPSYMKHTGTTSSDGIDRIVINLNYYPKKQSL